MAGFRVHAATALAASIGFASYISAVNQFPLAWGAGLCALGAVGGILPDIDSGETKIARYSGLFVGAACSVVIYLLSLSYLLSLVLFVPFAKMAHFLIDKCTTHRGVFHSVPMGLLLSIGVFSFCSAIELPQSFSLYCAAFLGGGYFIHLVLDEIWSLRKGISKHCSFGTALQLFRFTFWKSFAATYALLAFAIYRTPVIKDWLQKGIEF